METDDEPLDANHHHPGCPARSGSTTLALYHAFGLRLLPEQHSWRGPHRGVDIAALREVVMNDVPREQTDEEVKVRLLKQQIERSLLQVVELMNLAYRGSYQVRFEV